MNRQLQKGIQVSDPSPARWSSPFTRSSAGSTRLLPAGRNGARTVLLIASLLSVGVLFALTANLAVAKEVHLFSTSFGATGSGDGQMSLQAAGSGVVGSGLAVNEETHDVYVADTGNHRVDEFSSSGTFVRAFGADVGGAGVNVCTTGCVAGTAGSAPGAFEEPTFIAIDNSTGGEGDVYVADAADNLVTKFKADGSLITSWGTGGQLAGNGTTIFSELGQIAGLAVDSAGTLGVFLTESPGHLFKFTQAGVFSEVVETPRGSSRAGLAVEPAGSFFKINAAPDVEKFESSGADVGQVNLGIENSTGLAVDPSDGGLFVDIGSAIEEFKFEPSGEVVGTGCTPASLAGCPPTATFGSSHLTAGAGLAVDGTSGIVYAADPGAGRIAVFTAAVVVPDVTTRPASTVTTTSAILNGEVDPAGLPVTECFFEYGQATSYGHIAPCAAPDAAELGEGATPVPVHADLTALEPGATYHFRLVAANANGTDSESADQFFFTGAAIESTYTTEITATAATLGAQINPEGVTTTYHFEYIPVSAVRQNEAEGAAPFQGATAVPLPDGALGAGVAPVAVSQHVQGLAGDTAYVYRVVAESTLAHGAEPILGSPREFVTQTTASLILPDDRAWELISPPDKHGSAILPIQAGNEEENIVPLQSSASGEAIAYATTAPTEAGSAGATNYIETLSARGPAGWASRDLSIPHAESTGLVLGGGQEYRIFSEDLSRAVMQPFGGFEPALSPEASASTPFLHTNLAGPGAFCTSSCYRPLVTAAAGFANVPLGTEFGEDAFANIPGSGCPPRTICGPRIQAASPDLGHVAIFARVGLTAFPGDDGGLYEYSAAAAPSDQLRLLSVLPDGEPESLNGTELLIGGTEAADKGLSLKVRNAISPDGSRVFWTQDPISGGGTSLYLRVNATEPQSQVSGSSVDGTQCTEPSKACTIQLGGSGAEFQLASADGSVAFFTQGGDLFRYDLHTAQTTDLTPSGSLPGAVIGASEDGTTAYFVANAALAPGATLGNCQTSSSGPLVPGSACNLYRWHAGATAGGETSFIARLSGQDAPDWSGQTGSRRTGGPMTSRVSPNGEWLAFMSERSLTGYDNTDAVSGRPDEEVFLYHATGGGTLVCASCEPTGARPHGTEYGREGENFSVSGAGNGIWGDSQWLAASLPGFITPSHQPRYLSDSGRLFFDSRDALVPADTNGTEDVYQYEPAAGGEGTPPGDTCTTGSSTYGLASEGCVDLLSSGTSPTESAFLDASESGDDVFFLTASRLSLRDVDTSLDVYDARVGGGEPAVASPPVECQGDACQLPVTPPADATPGSLTFNGAGNVVECRKGKKLQKGKCVKKLQKKAKKKHHKKQHHKKSGHAKTKKQNRSNSKHGGQK
jgi:hypothetical protein